MKDWGQYSKLRQLEDSQKEKFSFKNDTLGVSVVAQQVKNSTYVREDVGSIPDLAQWDKDLALPQLW